MPRTKRPVRKQEKSTEGDDAMNKLDKLVKTLKDKLDSRAVMSVTSVEIAFKILMGSMRSDYLQKTVGQLKEELALHDVTNSRSTTRQSARSASHDDGYLTESSSQGSGERGAKKHHLGPPPPSASRSVSRSACRRSRSADASRSALKAAPKTTQRRRSRSVYRTPACKNITGANYPAITPKVVPHTPLTVLRQPRRGEMVVSMSGSPVMVPQCFAIQSDEKAHCNIMLQDGTMLSLQPNELRLSEAYIPFGLMDTDVMQQLETLKDNLAKVVQLGKKAELYNP